MGQRHCSIMAPGPQSHLANVVVKFPLAGISNQAVIEFIVTLVRRVCVPGTVPGNPLSTAKFITVHTHSMLGVCSYVTLYCMVLPFGVSQTLKRSYA